jgi:hypothetical protein
MSTDQNYDNHRHRPTEWNITWLAAVFAEVLIITAAVRQPLTAMSVGLVLLGAALVSGVAITRIYALRLQNRIIRTEMLIRLLRIGRDDDLPRLSMGQMVALRFASDAELAALLDRALAEQMKPDAIKRAVREWQGDYLRT